MTPEQEAKALNTLTKGLEDTDPDMRYSVVMDWARLILEGVEHNLSA